MQSETTLVNGVSLRERILAAGRRKSKQVTFGDATFTLRQLSAKDSAGYIDGLDSEDNDKRLSTVAAMIVASVFDEDGSQVFAESDIQEILSEMGTDGFGHLGGEVLALNSATKATREAAIKNSEAPASGLLSD